MRRIAFIGLIVFSTFGFKQSKNYELLVSSKGSEFKNLVLNFYDSLQIDSSEISKEAFYFAVKGYFHLNNINKLKKTKFLSIIDYSKSCNHERFYTIDMENQKLVFCELVAHGQKSGEEFSTRFSNSYRSHKSSIGFYLTGSTYYGRHNYSLKLYGLDKGYNSNAFSRGIVIHGAKYVSHNYISWNKRIGRSFGCPAVNQKVHKELINTIQGGSCLFAYYPNKFYLENNPILNQEVYLSKDKLFN